MYLAYKGNPDTPFDVGLMSCRGYNCQSKLPRIVTKTVAMPKHSLYLPNYEHSQEDNLVNLTMNSNIQVNTGILKQLQDEIRKQNKITFMLENSSRDHVKPTNLKKPPIRNKNRYTNANNANSYSNELFPHAYAYANNGKSRKLKSLLKNRLNRLKRVNINKKAISFLFILKA